MGGLMSKTAGVNLWSRICSWTPKWIASLPQDVHQPRGRRAILNADTVFRDVLDTEGKVVYGTCISGWNEVISAKGVLISEVTLLRELLRGETVNVFVGPERAQFSVPKRLLFYHSRVAQSSFAQYGGVTHFKEFNENALCLPEHAPETFEFILIWMYQRYLAIGEYCQNIFNSHGKRKEGLEAGFLLLCRVYILADYLEINGIIDLVMSECNLILWDCWNEPPDFPIGPDVVRTVFLNTFEGSRLYCFVVEKLAESLVRRSNGRPIEEYTGCFREIESFGTVIIKRVLELQSSLETKW